MGSGIGISQQSLQGHTVPYPPWFRHNLNYINRMGICQVNTLIKLTPVYMYFVALGKGHDIRSGVGVSMVSKERPANPHDSRAA
jgi:hypothetical protein